MATIEIGMISPTGKIKHRGKVHFRRLLRFVPIVLAACAWSSLPTLAQKSLYDAEACRRGGTALQSGDMEGALRNYCDMFAGRPEGALWTLSAMLVCEASQVAPYVASIRSPLPVFVQLRIYQGRPCYRICAGVTKDRSEAVRWRTLLPQELLAEGPFPVPAVADCTPSPALGGQGPTPTKAIPPAPAPVQLPLLPPAAPPVPSAITIPDSNHRAEGEAWFQKGLAAQSKGQRALALECYQSALRSDPERPEVLNNLGILSLQENRYAEARSLFDRALAKSPSYARAHLNLAGALWGLGQRDEALAEAQKAVTLDPKDVSAHLTLASFLLSKGLKTEASEEARRALLLDPNNEQAKVFLRTGASP